MRATAEAVEGNLVRLSVEIEEPEVDKVLDDVVRTLARDARIPGFRPGKVPRKVLEARMGGAVALRSEALREALPDFYARAIVDAEVDPIAAPEIDITSGEESGPVAFDAVVQVRPTVGVAGYQGLRVTIPGLAVTDEEVEAQIDRLRENEAQLIEVSRPAIDTDQVTINIHGTTAAGEEALGADDFLYSLGSGNVVPELDEQLRGSTPGQVLTFSATPEGLEEIAFTVLVKDVQAKQLPEVTDEWAAESSEFETAEALREDLRTRMGRVKVVQAQMALRDNAVAALIELVDDDEVPSVLVDEEVNQRVHDLSHRLEEQRLSIDQLLAATGRTGDDLLAEIRTDAQRAVKGDLALRAVADAESITVTDEELADEIVAMAARMELEPEDLSDQLDRAGRTGAVRSEQKKAKALTWLLDNVELVDDEGTPISRDALRADQGTDEEPSGAQDEPDEPSAVAEADGAEVTDEENV
jgi:trigger factor